MQFRELTGTGTFVIKTSPGYFQGIQVNLSAATTTLQVVDGTAGTGFPFIAGATAFALPAAGATPSYLYDCHFSNGLTVVVGGSGTFSLTVTYY